MKSKSTNYFLAILNRKTAVTSIVISFLGFAHGANRFWDGGVANIGANGDGVSGGTAGNWNTTLTNWDQGALPHVAWVNANNDTALFGGTAGTVTINAPVTAGALTFTTAGYTIAGTDPNILTLGGTSATITTSTLATSASTTFSTPLSGTLSGGLTIASNGDLSPSGGGAGGTGVSFTGTNTFVGNITVTSGLFRPVADSTLGDAANTITLNGGGLLASAANTISRSVAYGAANGTVRVYGSATLTLSGLQTGTGTLTKTDGGILVLTNSTNSRSGTTTIGAGELQALSPTVAGAYTTLGTGAITAASGSTLRFKTGSTAAAIIYANAINLNGATLISEDGNHTLNGAIAITGNNTLNGIYDGKNLTLAGVVSGAGNIAKTGPATLFLSGINTYTGGTAINGGILSVAAIADTGTSNLGTSVASTNYVGIANDSTLQYTGTVATTTTRYLWIDTGAGGKINISSATGSLTWNPAGGTRSKNFTKTGPGTLVMGGVISSTAAVTINGGNTSLNATNTYSGGTSLVAGNLSISNASGLGTGSLVNSSATGNTLSVANTAAIVLANNITLPTPASAQTYNIVKNSASATTGTELHLTGVISGGNANSTLLFNSSTGGDTTTNYRLSAVNTYTGTIQIYRGSIVVTNPASLGASTNVLQLNSNTSPLGDLRFGNAITIANPISLLYAATISSNGVNAGISGAISGTANFTKVGAGTLTLSGANTATGSSAVSAGTLALDYSTANNSKLSDVAALALASGSTIDLIGGSHTEIVDSTSISAGAGGPATISRTSGAATLQLGTITAAPGASINFTADGIATTNNSNNANGILGSWAIVNGTDWATNSTNAANGPITAFTGYTDVPFAGTIADNSSAQIRLNGGISGNVLLGSAVTNIGSLLQNQTTSTTIDSATKTLRLGETGSIFSGTGKGELTIANGTLTAGGGSVDVAGDLAITNSSSNAITINSNVTDNGTGVVTLTKAGPGPVILGGANTFTGAITIGAGTLEVGGTGSLATYNGGIVNSGAFLYSSSVNSTLSGVISGSGTLTKSGSSILSLAGTNTFTGATTINGGTLQITGTAGTLGTAAVTNNATLDFNRSNAVTVANAISGTGSVTQTGAGTTTLTGANTYTGGTVVSVGNLTANGTGTLPIIGTTAIATGATVTLNSATTNTYAQVFSGTGKIQLNLSGGANNTYLTGANTGFTGVLEVVGSGSNKFTATGLNLNPAATINVTAGNQIYVNAPVANSVFIVGTGNGENRGAIRLGNTLSGAVTLYGDTTIGGEGGISSGPISGGIVSAMTLTLGTANSTTGATFNGDISNGSATSLAITALNGTNTLNGSNSYTGTTTVTAGTLTIAGTQTGAGAVTINGTSTLNLLGNVTGSTITMAAGTTLRGEGNAGGLIFSGAGNIVINPASAGAMTSSGALTMTGATTVSFAAGAPPTAGAIRVLNFGSTTATAANFALANAASYRSPVFSVSATAVDLTLGNTDLIWTGIGGANWDVNATTNWNDTTPAASKFFFGDAVTFNDAPGANQTIGLAVSVQPSNITVNNSTYNYTIAGAGAIAGTTGLTKTGTANLDLGGTNTFTGNTTITGGIVKMLTTTALGANTANVSISGGGTLDLGNLAANGISFLGPRITSISGSGVGGNGVIINSGAATQINAFSNVTLTGNATIGGISRYDFRGATAITDLAGFTLTKTGPNQVYAVVDGTVTSGNMNVNGGILAFWNGTVQGTGEIKTSTGGNLELSNMVAGKFTRQITMNGGTVSSLSTAVTSGNVVYTAASDFSNTSQLTMAGAISGGAYDLVKTGAGTLILSGSNALTGKVNVSTGTLRVTSDALLGAVPGAPVADSITLQSGAKIQGGNDLIGNDLTIDSKRGINLPAGDGGFQVWNGFTTNYGGAISGAGNLVKTDTGTLIYTGTATHTGSTNLVTGIFTLTGASLNNTSNFSVQNGTLNINAGTSITTPTMKTSDASGANSVVNHIGGTINITGTVNSGSASSAVFGHWSATTVYNLSGGSLNALGSPVIFGWDSPSTVMNQSGGTANLLGLNLNNGRNNAGAYNLTGGRLNLGASGVLNASTVKQLNLGGGTVGAFADWSSAQNTTFTDIGGSVTFNTLDSVDNTTAHNIILSGALSGTGGLIKNGAGNLVLSGTKTYTGATAVNGGTLYTGTALSSSPISVNAGGTVQAGAIATSTTSTLSSLALNGGSAAFRANYTTGDKLVVSTIDGFSVPIASSISVTPAGDLIVGDTITLIDYEGTLGGLGFGGLSLAPLANPHFGASLVNNSGNSSVDIEITAIDSVVWMGNINGNWNLNTTSNWKTQSDNITSKFYAYDAVIFDDDGAASPAVTLSGTIQPSSVLFDASVDYTLSGAPIIGNGGLLKNNTGKVTLLNNNTYVGTTKINNGTIVVGDGTTTGALGGTGNIAIDITGALELNRSDAQTLTRTITGGGTLVKSGSNTLTMNAANNVCDIVINNGTLAARSGGWSTNFAANRKITVNAPGILDTAVHSLGGLGGATRPNNIVINEDAIWKLNGEQQLPNTAVTMTAGIVNGPGEIRGGGTIVTIAHATKSSLITAPFNNGNGSVAFNVGDGAVATDLSVTGNLSGANSYSKTGAGTLLLSGNNTYTGGTALNGGTLEASSIADAGGAGSIGTGYLGIANDATFRYTGTGAETTTRPLWIDTGIQNKTIEVTSATGAITFNSTAGNVNKPFTKTGPGALTIIDEIQTGATVTVNAGTLTLSGVNTYTGDTIVNGGTLEVNGSSINNANKLTIDGGHVSPTGIEVVNTLYFGATQQLAGTYGATGSGATYTDNARFSGTGVVSVVTGPSGYLTWAASKGLDGTVGKEKGLADDPDQDGISNLSEFYFDGDPLTNNQSILPQGTTDGTYLILTYKRRDDANTDIASQSVQWGSDLSTWSPGTIRTTNGTNTDANGVVFIVADNGTAPDDVTIKIPMANAISGKLFGRVVITK